MGCWNLPLVILLSWNPFLKPYFTWDLWRYILFWSLFSQISLFVLTAIGVINWKQFIWWDLVHGLLFSILEFGIYDSTTSRYIVLSLFSCPFENCSSSLVNAKSNVMSFLIIECQFTTNVILWHLTCVVSLDRSEGCGEETASDYFVIAWNKNTVLSLTSFGQ